MNKVSRLTAATIAALVAVTPAMAAGYGATAKKGAAMHEMSSDAMGGRLMTADGMSLYMFDKDGDGKSNCYGKCAKEWPPMKAPANVTPSSHFSVIKRKDGTRQWAWMGKPLYMFDEDKVAGDIKGGSYSPDWHVAHAMQ